MKHLATIILGIFLIQPLYAQDREVERAIPDARASALVGAWVIDVRNVAAPPFTAMQTFHAGGSMNESTDLLANLGEGPGHGAWRREGDTFTATFELFIFNPDRTPAGIIRVRETLTIVDADNLTGFAVADIILPDGTLIEDIDHGGLTGRRVRLAPVRAEEQQGFPLNARFARARGTH